MQFCVGVQEKGRTLSLNILMAQDNKSLILKWQFKHQWGKNILGPPGQVYELCLFYCGSICGGWSWKFIESGLTS